MLKRRRKRRAERRRWKRNRRERDVLERWNLAAEAAWEHSRAATDVLLIAANLNHVANALWRGFLLPQELFLKPTLPGLPHS